MEFKGNLYIQTLFLKGTINNKIIDNTNLEEIDKWLIRLNRIKPRFVMLYSLDRIPPYSTLEKISEKELASIAMKVKNAGFDVEYYL
jgi:hypothetical protein